MGDSEIDASAECMERLLAWLQTLKSTNDQCMMSAPLLPIQPDYRHPLPGSPAAKREEILAHALGVSLA